MKYYFSHIEQDHWTLKNNAQKEARALAQNAENLLIGEDTMSAFISGMMSLIEEINLKHPRCKPVRLYIEHDYHNQRTIWVDGNFSMILLPVKGFFKNDSSTQAGQPDIIPDPGAG